LTFVFSGPGGGSESINGDQVVRAACGNGPGDPVGCAAITAGKTNLAVWITGLGAFNTVTVSASNEAFEFSPGTPVGVPDGGTTLALLGSALMGLGILRRKFNA
jgi:hypothetical protein